MNLKLFYINQQNMCNLFFFHTNISHPLPSPITHIALSDPLGRPT